MTNQENSDREIYIPGFPILFSKKFIEEMIASVMALYGSKDLEPISHLRRVVRGHIYIPGYRKGKADKANPEQIRLALLEHWLDNPELCNAVLKAWSLTQADLVKTCDDWVTENITINKVTKKLVGEQADETDQETGEEEQASDLINSVVEGFLDTYPEMEQSEAVELALCMAVYKCVEEANANQPEMIPPGPEWYVQMAENWEAILKTFQAIPAEDKFWDTFDDFISRAQKIATTKQVEREQQGIRGRLDQILQEQMPALVEASAYFQVPTVDHWAAKKCPTDHATEAVKELTAMSQLLQDFKLLEKQSPPTRVERRNWENQLHGLEERILSLFEVLHSRFEAAEESMGEREDKPTAVTEDEVVETSERQIQEQEPATPVAELENEDVQQVEGVHEKSVTPVEQSPDGSVQTGEVTGEVVIQEILETEVIPPGIVEASPEVDGEIIVEQKDAPIDKITEVEIPTTHTVITSGEATSEPEKQEIPPEASEPAKQAQPEYDLITSYISDLHLPSAYWLSWGLEQTGKDTCIQPWLIAAAQGVLWHQSLWPEPLVAFTESITEFVRPEDRLFEFEHDHLGWLALATGIYMNMVDPSGRWENWLDVPLSNTPAHITELIQIVRKANRMGIYLDPMVIQILTNAESVDQHIRQLAGQAKDWLHQAPTRGAHILRAAQVWQTLIRQPNGELYKLVQVVASDQRSQATKIQDQLKHWRDRSWLDKKIQKIDLEISGRKSRPIVGGARDQIIGWVSDIVEIMDQYCHALIQSESIQKNEDWIAEHLQELVKECKPVLIGVREELLELSYKVSDVNERNALAVASRVFEGLEAIIALGGYSALTAWPQPPYWAEFEGIKPQPGLIDHLAYSLLYYPELELENNGLPDPADASQLVAVLMKMPSRSAEEVIDGWIAEHDYRFIPLLLSELENREIWETRVGEALRIDLQRLENKDIEDTVINVEQSLLEGIIAEEEHTDFKSRIESIRKQLRQAERDAMTGLSIRSISRQLQDIRSSLNEKRQERLDNQRAHWEEIKKQLPHLTGRDQKLARKIEPVVEQSLREKDLRVTGEYLAHLNDVLNGVKEIAPSLFEVRPGSESYIALEFQDAVPSLVNLLEESRSRLSLDRISEMILRDKPIPGFPMPRLPKPRLEDSARALDAWRGLKKHGLTNPETNLALVATLMSYLGFTLIGNRPVSIKPLQGSLPNFQHWRVAASAGKFSPVAQFGSQRKGYYDVVGVWERPDFEIISSQVNLLMKETGNKPTILFYFGRLLPAQRDDLLTATHKGRLPMLVVDEALILFLTRQYGTRLKPMFYCTLPYAALNPFFPAAAGLVPPEVFKGRDDLVVKLKEPFGPSIVYGGRQLGKSALLRQVQREFHHPENGIYVIYEDIKLVGDPVSGKYYQADLRDRLVMALSNQKLLDKDQAALDLDRLFNQLLHKITERKLEILLLLDEADHFLDADAEKNFSLIQKFKNLMDQTDHRFKIVLAGLHNVQRFQRIPNQPLAHLVTDSIEIGPLDPEPARELLVEPLHALGYHFGEDQQKEDISLVLHILSYTNYHPGLIQLFGSYLVENLQNKYQQSCQLPFTISRSDVEAVYRKKEVRDAICERFNWTLALDPRYEAITLALILEQWDDQNGFDRLYTAKQLHEVAVSWWSEAFGDEITDDQFKGFLDEMRGLGVLSTNPDGNYRLRSPNLVSLMGTHDQIWDRLGSLVRGTPPGERALDSYHAILEGEGYSPLSFVQERALNNPKSGVALIFGSQALGIRLLGKALQRLVPPGTGAWGEIRVAARNGNAIQQQLSNMVQRNSSASFLVVYRDLDGDSDELVDQVLTAERYCHNMRSRTLRVCFALDTQSAWQWFQLPLETRKAIEERVTVIVPLKRWDRLGIKQRLEMEPWGGEEMVPNRLLNKALEITGGWPFLLDEFFTRKDGPDPLTALGEFRLALYNPDSVLRRNFIKALSIYDTAPRRIIEALLNDELQKMIQEGQPYSEVLSLILEDLPIKTIENIVEYLNRLAIVATEAYPAVEPVLAQLWNEA